MIEKVNPMPTLTQSSAKLARLSSIPTLRSTYQGIICLSIGFIIGIYVTGIRLRQTPQYGGTLSTLGAGLNPTSAALRRNNKNTTTATKESMFRAQHTSSTIKGHVVDLDLAEYLHNTTRVLCWIMTNPDNHLKKAIHIRHTWGRRCNKLLFMSSQEDEVLQTVALPVEEGRQHLWRKTKLALKYIYDHHLDDAEWFLKADDDTYVIMENLRLFLYRYPAEAPIYFGCKFYRYISQGYMSGGEGYVLSKQALISYSTQAYDNSTVCDDKYREEDVQLGRCLENIGIIAGDSRDDEGKERFIPLAPELVLPVFTYDWYPKFVYHEANGNVSCCSPQAISFHYIDRNGMYALDYLLYELRPFGLAAHLNESLPAQLSVSDILSEALDFFQPAPAPPAADEDLD